LSLAPGICTESVSLHTVGVSCEALLKNYNSQERCVIKHLPNN